MKKYLVFILLLGFFIFFQSTVFYSELSIRGVQPDFVLIILCIGAYILGPMPGQVLGFASGLILDLLTGGLLGISAFTYTVVGYGVGLMGTKLYGRSLFTSAIIMFFSTILKAVLLSLAAAIFLEKGYFGYFTHGRVFLEAILNSFLAPPLFFIVQKFEQRVAE